MVWATSASTSLAFVTSVLTKNASPPAAWISFTVSADCSRRRLATTTLAPWAAKACAMARPLPELSPVTSATCPSNDLDIAESQRAVRAILHILAPTPLSHRGDGDVVAIGQHRQRSLAGMNFSPRAWRRAGLGMNSTHWLCSGLKDSIMPRSRLLALNSGQLRMGT